MTLEVLRKGAKLAAYVDLLGILSSSALFDTVIYVLTIAFVVINKDLFEKLLEMENAAPDFLNNLILKVCTDVIVPNIITAAIKTWAAIMLFKATKKDVLAVKDKKLAVKRINIWMYTSIVFTLSHVIFYGASQSFLSLAFKIFKRGILLLIVSEFRSTLERHIRLEG